MMAHLESKMFWNIETILKRDETTPELPISLRKFVKMFKGCFCSIEQLNNLLTVHPKSSKQLFE